MTLAEWIKAERAAGRRITQRQVAERCGVHHTTLNRVVKGKLEARARLMRDVWNITGGKVGLLDWPAGEIQSP